MEEEMEGEKNRVERLEGREERGDGDGRWKMEEGRRYERRAMRREMKTHR